MWKSKSFYHLVIWRDGEVIQSSIPCKLDTNPEHKDLIRIQPVHPNGHYIPGAYNILLDDGYKYRFEFDGIEIESMEKMIEFILL